MSVIIGPIGLEQLELFALELRTIAAFDFVYSVASKSINQSAPNLVKIRPQMTSLIMDQSMLSALEMEKNELQ